MLLIDTREKPGAIKSIVARLDQQGVPYARQKLDVGDYLLTENPALVIDRKQNLGELLTNLCSPDKARFWREVRRARDTHVKLIVLVEHGPQVKRIEDVALWQSKYSRVSGRELMERIYACHTSYGVEFLFCRKQDTGRRIVQLLTDALPGGQAARP